MSILVTICDVTVTGDSLSKPFLHLSHMRSVEFALHPQHETSFNLEKRPFQDFKQVQKATRKFVNSLIE